MNLKTDEPILTFRINEEIKLIKDINFTFKGINFMNPACSFNLETN